MNLLDELKEKLKTALTSIEVTDVSFSGYSADQTIFVSGSVLKADEEQQIVYGFASVVEVDGEPLVDLHGDIIEEADLIKAAHRFMSQYRHGHVQHSGEEVGEVVESLVFTKDLQQALGIDLGMVGWFCGYKVKDPEVWKMVKQGNLPMFSIGGSAVRESIDA